MVSKKTRITVYEHQTLQCNRDDAFTVEHLKALQSYYGEKGCCYFSLIHNGVRFCEYVGVLQVKNLIIEVLPKADKNVNKGENEWRRLLIDMLKSVGVFNVRSTSEADLMLRQHSILDLYIEIFLDELEKLLHQGLIKKYRKTEGNQLALKGSLDFGKHIQLNYIHKERFYVEYTLYDRDNPINQVLGKTVQLIKSINVNPVISSRINTILLNFPEFSPINVDEKWFESLHYTRKNEHYRPVIEIARLLLLNYHPDIRQGRFHVLALMFDMNLLWEKFILSSLRRSPSHGIKMLPQERMTFWKSANGKNAGLKPDILIKTPYGNYILDTKWKLTQGMQPEDRDLQQMFAYNQYFSSGHTVLIYPGEEYDFVLGSFQPVDFYRHNEGRCSVLKIALPKPDQSTIAWQKQISNYIIYNLFFHENI